jgi:tRNA (mo5U34)-methyltransferase
LERDTADSGHASSGGADVSAIPTAHEIQQGVDALGPWFQNLDLYGVRTAPQHYLGDYPTVKWQRFSSVVSPDLGGKSVLDIGCNAGFYAIEMKRRNASRVLGVDTNDEYLAQACFAAKVMGLDIEFRKMSVYDVAALRERFDVVLFMGVLYHLRHPLLALDLLHEHAVKELLLFQSMQRGSDAIEPLQSNYDFWTVDQFDSLAYPKLHFVEQRYADDPTNWWIPNRACVEAMLRSAGFSIIDHPEPEVYLCRRADRAQREDPVYPCRGEIVP